MKRGIIVLVFFGLFMMSFVLSDNHTDPQSPEEIKEEFKETFNLFKQQEFFGNSSFESEIEIPEWLSLPAYVVLGFERGESISVEKFVLVIASFIAILMVIWGVVEFIPVFGKGKALKFVFSFIVTVLIAMSGALFFLISNLLTFVNFFGWLDKLGVFKLVAVVIGILLALYFLHWIRIKVGYKLDEEKGEVAAENAKDFSAAVRASSDSFVKKND